MRTQRRESPKRVGGNPKKRKKKRGKWEPYKEREKRKNI